MQVLNTWSKDHMQQQDLFNPMELSPSHRAILMHYAGAKALSVEQGELYAAEAMRMGMRQEDLKAREPVGKSRTAHSVRTHKDPSTFPKHGDGTYRGQVGAIAEAAIAKVKGGST